MAHSRLEKIGTIVTRTQGLLRSGAMKWDDRPLWYDVVTAFPPKEEPRYDRPAPNVAVRPIFYAEDKVRAKFQSSNRTQYISNMSDLRNKTPTQHFIEIHQKLAGQGALDSERVFETAQELLEQKLGELRQEKSAAINILPAPQQPEAKGKTVQLQDIFKE
ncbi:probable 28S ribosomal protein S23, mitochondrial [Culex quinquefasciatus]|uniref:probable 28S ribosomal protein S23, mitochondrial n=1 Tax=Culex quinquefasciatus TaxID=7176 RepID=UPI0018E3DB5A|nr:probable 28S ribosomal protein S23, mitochondrial [Culex quinquefasciatus]